MFNIRGDGREKDGRKKENQENVWSLSRTREQISKAIKRHRKKRCVKIGTFIVRQGVQ